MACSAKHARALRLSRYHQRHLHQCTPNFGALGIFDSGTASPVRTGGLPAYRIARDPSRISRPRCRHRAKFPQSRSGRLESGGDNLAATFSPELDRLTIYVIGPSRAGRQGGYSSKAARESPVPTSLVTTDRPSRPMSGVRWRNGHRRADGMRGERPFVMNQSEEDRGAGSESMALSRPKGGPDGRRRAHGPD